MIPFSTHTNPIIHMTDVLLVFSDDLHHLSPSETVISRHWLRPQDLGEVVLLDFAKVYHES